MGFLKQLFGVQPLGLLEDTSPLAHKNVLLLLDNPHVREMWHMHLDSCQCNTIVAANGINALSLASSTSLDVAVVDSSTKDIPCSEICKTLRNGSPRVILFLVKGMFTRRANDAEAKEGIWGVLDKSANRGVFLGQVLHAINEQAEAGA